MPDWLTPPRLLLLAVPVAMVLAANALAAGERRAQAQRARDMLGKPRRRVEEATVGERVLLEGRLEVASGPCTRFEDGAPAAAATVESSGPRAIPERFKARVAPDGSPHLAHTARAEVLVLTVGSERVVVNGPALVWVGTDEMDPGTAFGSLAADVRERIADVADRTALPGPTAEGPVHAWPLFRSLRDGARVRAIGTLVQQSEGERTGYRERARWALTGDAAEPVVLAYEGTPRYRGPTAAAIRGVRHLSWVRAVAAIVAVTALFAGLAVLGSRYSTKRPPLTKVSLAPERPNFADPADCRALVERYQAAARDLESCEVDSDCAAEVRGGVYFSLEGCYRFRNREKATSVADGIEREWLNEGCASSYEICPPAPQAMCRQNRCVERPPVPIPEDWHREEVLGAFFLYLPPGTRFTGLGDVVPASVQYTGDGLTLSAEFDDEDAELEERLGKPSRMSIGGYKAYVWKSASETTVSFEKRATCGPPRCPYFGEEGRLTLHATCSTPMACDDVALAIQSVRFW